MNDRQWIATTAFAGVFASAFLYVPFIGGMTALIIVAAIQGMYLGWQEVLVPQSRLGALSFALGVFVGMPIMGMLLTHSGPGNLWGIAALFAIVTGVVSMFVARLVRARLL
jgi:hypothetical protein